MIAVEIPFSARPQRASVTLGTTQYRIRLVWNVPANCWVADFDDTLGNPVLHGVPLVTGANLLTQYEYLGFGGQLLVVSDQGPPDAVPTWISLGVTGHVLFVTP